MTFSIPVLLQLLDLFGTMAFAVTGALKAIEHKMDIVGIVILACSTGLAGGIIRDIILNRIPPKILIDPFYLAVAVSTGLAVFFLYRLFKENVNLFLKFDAIGLGVFSVLGASIAYETFGLSFIAMTFAGMATAIGGGILRDVFVREIPLVFVKELYASASFLGIVIFFVMLYFNVNYYFSMLTCIVIITGFRLLAMKYNWNLPRLSTDKK